MPRPGRSAVTALFAAAAIGGLIPTAAATQEVAGETPYLAGVEIERPTVDLDRVAGVAISTFDPPGGPTAGTRRAVFELGRGDRRTIADHVRDGAASFRLSAVFTNRTSARAVKALRFRLRR